MNKSPLPILGKHYLPLWVVTMNEAHSDLVAASRFGLQLVAQEQSHLCIHMLEKEGARCLHKIASTGTVAGR